MNPPIQNSKTIFLADDDAEDCKMFEDALKELRLETLLTISNDGVELFSGLSI